MNLDDRVSEVRQAVSDACDRSGRSIDDVIILPVTKGHPPEIIQQLNAYGFQQFGESKVQEAGYKATECSSGIDWHMIGHLQSNKARVAASLFGTIHSVDSINILQKLDKEAGENGDRLDVYLQVNVANEHSKYGFATEAIPQALEAAQELMNLNVVGLMLIPPATDEAENVRPWFAKLRELRDEWRSESGFPLEELSMGMSNDYSIAIEEGATVVRLGRCLVGPRKKGL